MKKNRKLIWRIYPSFLLIIIISLGSLTGYTSNSIRKFFLNQTKKDLTTQAFLVEKKIAEYLYPLNQAKVKQFCNELGDSVDTRITVILPNGKVIGDSNENPDYMDNHQNRPEIAIALKNEIGSSVRYSGTLSQNMMYVAIPVKKNNELKAVIRASVPITSVEKELDTIQMDRVVWGIITALLASIFALVLSRRISRPIEEMKKGAENYARGDFNYYLPIPDTLELASLAESMNDMAIQLENRITTIVNQRNEYEAVLTSMIEGVIAVDIQERILSINQAAMTILGIRSEKLKYQSIQEMIRNSELQKLVNTTLSERKPLEQDIIIRGENDRILNLKCRPLFNADNDNMGALIILNDVTRLRLLEDVRKDFVANVSHELKTPLTTIKGFVETLINGSLTENPEESERFLKIINKHVDRLNTIIEDLLSLARIEKLDEKLELRFEEKNIQPVIETAIQLIQSKADEKNIDLDLECNTTQQVKIDTTLLEQALFNLLDNAIKYSSENSKIRIKADANDTEIAVSIEDEGSGIHKKHIPRLFERFYRADKARSRELGGTGLGLAIVKHIIQLHSGRVTVSSIQGKGSTFTLHLPVSKIPKS
ncbi:HAMP domain-containing protein [bacterium]|nr:HAMP domain-containing protein [bacterium]